MTITTLNDSQGKLFAAVNGLVSQAIAAGMTAADVAAVLSAHAHQLEALIVKSATPASPVQAAPAGFAGRIARNGE
jgi:hypothetical protein